MSGYGSLTVFFVIVWAIAGSACDIERRKIPNRLILAFLCLSTFAWAVDWLPFHWSALIVAVALGFMGNLQPGDIKSVALLAGLLDIESTAVMFLFAFLIGTGAMGLYFFKIIGSPKHWPYFPFFAVPACVIVVAHWIGG